MGRYDYLDRHLKPAQEKAKSSQRQRIDQLPKKSSNDQTRKSDFNFPSLFEWDFEGWPRKDCPADQWKICLPYEYALDSEKVRRGVMERRKPLRRLEIPTVTTVSVTPRLTFSFPYIALAKIDEFPNQHWLDLSETRRKELPKEIGSLIDCANVKTAYKRPMPSPCAGTVLQRLI